jgi:hypothetical protein
MTAPGLGGVPPEQLLAARRSALFLLTLTDYGVIDLVMRSKLDALLDDVTAELQDRAGHKYLKPPRLLKAPQVLIHHPTSLITPDGA